MSWLAAIRHAWKLWKNTEPAEREIIHDCRPIATPAGSLTGRLTCRTCQKPIGRHEQIDRYGNWQHPRAVQRGSYVLDRSGATYVGKATFLGGYDLEDTSGACGFPGCRCVETNRRAIQFGFDLAGDPLFDCIEAARGGA